MKLALPLSFKEISITSPVVSSTCLAKRRLVDDACSHHVAPVVVPIVADVQEVLLGGFTCHTTDVVLSSSAAGRQGHATEKTAC